MHIKNDYKKGSAQHMQSLFNSPYLMLYVF